MLTRDAVTPMAAAYGEWEKGRKECLESTSLQAGRRFLAGLGTADVVRTTRNMNRPGDSWSSSYHGQHEPVWGQLT